MRRVVTGEELAQLYNPDPFAMPRWRAPVYRTPLGIILAVKFARLLGWMVRLIVRHPLAASVLALSAVTWVKLGWVTLVGPGPGRRRHAAGLAVVLAGLVLPVGRPPGPGQVADLVLPAPLGRGHDHRRGGAVVSGPDPAARAGQGHRHPVHRPGAGPAGLRPVRGRLRRITRRTWRTGSARCCAGSARPGPARWCWSSSAATPWPPSSPPCPIPAHPDLKALPVGRREDGLPWLVKLHGTHVLIAGATGAGKASLLWGLVRAMFPLMQAGLVRVLAADPKLMELAYGRVIFESYGAYAADPASIAAMLDRRWPTCRPGLAGSPDGSATTPPRSRTRSPWCWSMRSRS